MDRLPNTGRSPIFRVTKFHMGHHQKFEDKSLRISGSDGELHQNARSGMDECVNRFALNSARVQKVMNSLLSTDLEFWASL